VSVIKLFNKGGYKRILDLSQRWAAIRFRGPVD
jgi:hypothetical protein